MDKFIFYLNGKPEGRYELTELQLRNRFNMYLSKKTIYFLRSLEVDFVSIFFVASVDGLNSDPDPDHFREICYICAGWYWSYLNGKGGKDE